MFSYPLLLFSADVLLLFYGLIYCIKISSVKTYIGHIFFLCNIFIKLQNYTKESYLMTEIYIIETCLEVVFFCIFFFL